MSDHARERNIMGMAEEPIRSKYCPTCGAVARAHGNAGWTWVLLACVWLAAGPLVAPAGVVFVKPTGNDASNGLGWDTAKQTVTAGLAAATSGDQVWVAAGTYVERITLKQGVGLYGGFVGSEDPSSFSVDDRDLVANRTTLDGNAAGTVVTGPYGATASCRIDGFTITHGNALQGGGLSLHNSSPTVANNTITGNSATWGGGLYLNHASPTVINNRIAANSVTYDGGGLALDFQSAPTITNNVIVANRGQRGGGLYVDNATPTVAGNTLTSNGADSGGALYLNNASPTIANTIIAFNSSGILNGGSAGSPTLRFNCVYGNGQYDYSGIADPTGTDGNISVDPQITDFGYGGWHVEPTSPCVDAGNNADALGGLDQDGQPRIQPVGGTVDIGADESDGTLPMTAHAIVRVSLLGDDSYDGSSWALAKRTVQAGIEAAAAVGGEVWVQAGTYGERITLRPLAHLYGGFAGVENTRAERNWAANTTTLDGQHVGSVVTASNLPPGGSTLDGFTVTQGYASLGGGLYLLNSASPAILNNRITGNQSSLGGRGGGLYLDGSSPLIANNVITANRSTLALTAAGVYLTNGASPTIVSNTIVANDGPGGLYMSGSSPTVVNSIIAFNGTGIHVVNGSPTLRHNCVYGNGQYDYSGVSDPTGTDGNISVDPEIADFGYGGWHLQPGSPCIDAGSNVDAHGDSDLDGQPRVQPVGGSVDIGADESDGTQPVPMPHAIVRVSLSGNDAQDGSSWALAKRTVQAGIDAAAALGAEVWVQAGTYNERITLRPLAHIYGGFAGHELTREERDWAAHVTTLDGQQNGAVVTAVILAAGVSTLDGFTLTHGKRTSGGGVYLSYAAPTLVNNTITDNSATNGGGLYLAYSAPTIAGNIVINNSATDGAGLYLNQSTPLLVNDAVLGNSATSKGAGLYLNASSPMIVNNTIARNFTRFDGGGFYVNGGAPTIVNTLVAFNSSGLFASGGTPTLLHNCVYGNAAYAYSGVADPTGVAGNIAIDPAIADVGYGGWHLEPGSPCIDAGNNADVHADVDLDGEPRLQPVGGTVDIGADESNGAAPAPQPHVIVRVSLSGDDSQDGSSWAHAKRTVQAATNAAAAAFGGEVWVQTGTYTERIALKPLVHLYGGFAGFEQARDERDWVANVSTLDGQHTGAVVAGASLAPKTSTLDGFTIINGSGSSGGGVYLSSASPMIMHNTITDCSGAGIYAISGSAPTITNNTVRKNATARGGGLYLESSSGAAITDNIISGNIAQNSGGGVHLKNSSPTIAGNAIRANRAPDGGGLYLDHSSPTMANNTIAGNTASSQGGALYLGDGTAPTIANTLVAFNSSGIFSTNAAPVLRYNCVYGNTSYDYSGLANPTGSNGNISADPTLVDLGYGGWQLALDSPCIDAGDNADVQGELDLDGQPRIQPAGGVVDIGADESDGTLPAPPPHAVVRVSPSGNDNQDGSSWLLAKQTVQAGLNAASALGGEVWVQAGMYYERIELRAFAHAYGGFAGDENVRAERDWANNVTTLHGQGGGSVVKVSDLPSGTCTLDGFTITHGSAANGGGMYVSAASPTIENNTFTGNSANSNGGGLYLSKASPRLANNMIVANTAASYGGGLHLAIGSAPLAVNNTIAGNHASSGGGLYLASCSPAIVSNAIMANTASFNGGGLFLSSAAPMITSNAITDNAASYGGGLYLGSSSPVIANNTVARNTATNQGGALYVDTGAPTVTNTVVALNSSGIFGSATAATLRFNCVYGNTGYNYSGIPNPTGTNGNISADPLFSDPDGVDNDSNTWADNDYRLVAGSPCIDAGENASVPTDTFDLDDDGNTTEPLPFDLYGLPRFFDDPNAPDCPWAPSTCGMSPIVDMGAYEFQGAGPAICPGDVNCDGAVTYGDIDPFVARLGCPGSDLPACDTGCPWQNADINGDGGVTFADIDPFVGQLGTACQ